MPGDSGGKIYSATYSNVPVYEVNVEGNHVMRRRADDWINATHILKVADFDKPARTRILEREVQKGVHEKVQGGYGKYQGTWIPLQDGRTLAERNGVLPKLQAIFDFVPGDRSPPPAPKHAIATSSKPKAPRPQNNNRRVPVPHQPPIEERFEVASAQYEEEESQMDGDMMSESMMDEQDFMNSQYSTGSRKRKRDALSYEEQQHQLWADSLLDYFMLMNSDQSFPTPPEPPPGVNLDRQIDDKGHSAMHWAAAMGDVDVVRDLISRGARIDCTSLNLETPLMRAVMFTNNFDKNTMPSMAKTFQSTVHKSDWFGCTVFHHIAATTSSKHKYACARYYFDCIINKLYETWNADEVSRLLNRQDNNGDTAIMIAARNGARKCVRSLLGRNVAVDIPNVRGETADDLIRELNLRRRDGRRAASSSPFAPDGLTSQRVISNGDSTALVPGFPSALTHSQNALQTSTALQAITYRSQTSNTIMQKVAPTVLERCEHLAVAYEAELEEKENEQGEAEGVVAKRVAELEATRRQIKELEMAVGAVDEGIDMQGEEELHSLVLESEALLELEQRSDLTRLIQQKESNTPQIPQSPNPSAEVLLEKLRLSILLSRAQQDRRELVREVVRDRSVAGTGEKQNVYKKLIRTALAVREDDVESMLPEILRDLEEQAMDDAEGQVAPTMGKMEPPQMV